jgi:signal transduction histidine kinase
MSSIDEIVRFIDLTRVTVPVHEFTAQERAALDNVNHRVASGDSLADVMDFVFESSRELFPCDRLSISFVQEDDRVASHWTRALYTPLLLQPGYSEDLRQSTLARVRDTGCVRIIDDLNAYLEVKPHSTSTQLLVREGVRSSMTCPLFANGRNAGFLFRSSRNPGAYAMHEVLLHSALAERLSQAVEKAYRNEQLTAANQAYGEMLGFVSHELKSPLGAIVMDASVLEQGFLGRLEPRQAERLQKISGKARHLLTLIQDYLDLARVEGSGLNYRPRPGVDFTGDVVQPVLDGLQTQLEEQRTRFAQDFPESPSPVDCDPGLLNIVMANLLGNAVKYGNEEGLIRLRVSQPEGQLAVSVWNAGPGFPKSERSKLFKKFSRLQSRELMARKGSGVGLYTCWRIIQAHGGRIRADSEPGAWAEFSFEIPQPLPSTVRG